MKTSAFLTELLLPELTRYSGIAFTYPDRMTRAEAQRVRDWAARTPEVRRLLTDKGPNHKEAMVFREMVDYYAFEHGEDNGAPASWPARLEPRPQATADNPLGNLFPDELRALQEWTLVSPEFNERYTNEKHPEHAHAVQQRLKLAELVSAADRAEASEQAKDEAKTPANAPLDRAKEDAFTKRLGELRADPAYSDARHPGHKAAVEAVTKLYEERARGSSAAAASGVPNGTPRADVPAAAAPVLTPQQQIAAKRADKEFLAIYHNPSHEKHAESVREMSALYAAAFPEPGAPSDAGPSPSSSP